jgi:hypothetical protein
MNVYYTKGATKALDDKLKWVKGKGSQNLAEAIAREVAEGNTRDRLAGLDRYGKPFKPVKKRTGKYAGKTGPPLAPSGAASRVITRFRAQARRRGGDWQVVAGWENVVSDKGVPFLPFHDQGAVLGGKKGGKGLKAVAVVRALRRLRARVTGRGVLPRRPLFGISPKTWAQIRARLDQFKKGATKFP